MGELAEGPVPPSLAVHWGGASAWPVLGAPGGRGLGRQRPGSRPGPLLLRVLLQRGEAPGMAWVQLCPPRSQERRAWDGSRRSWRTSLGVHAHVCGSHGGGRHSGYMPMPAAATAEATAQGDMGPRAGRGCAPGGDKSGRVIADRRSVVTRRVGARQPAAAGAVMDAGTVTSPLSSARLLQAGSP